MFSVTMQNIVMVVQQARKDDEDKEDGWRKIKLYGSSVHSIISIVSNARYWVSNNNFLRFIRYYLFNMISFMGIYLPIEIIF